MRNAEKEKTGSSGLGRIYPKRKTGGEVFRLGKVKLPLNLLSFWKWNCSDLVSNATRGILAEYIVGRALGLAKNGVRDEWAAYDLCTPEGIKIEVKSAAYLQSWHQNRLSNITFATPKTRAWDPDTNIYSKDKKRQATYLHCFRTKTKQR